MHILFVCSIYYFGRRKIWLWKLNHECCCRSGHVVNIPDVFLGSFQSLVVHISLCCAGVISNFLFFISCQLSAVQKHQQTLPSSEHTHNKLTEITQRFVFVYLFACVISLCLSLPTIGCDSTTLKHFWHNGSLRTLCFVWLQNTQIYMNNLLCPVLCSPLVFSFLQQICIIDGEMSV